jgi:hypothetical protein
MNKLKKINIISQNKNIDELYEKEIKKNTKKFEIK